MGCFCLSCTVAGERQEALGFRVCLGGFLCLTLGGVLTLSFGERFWCALG
jgi:hypothetical protein